MVGAFLEASDTDIPVLVDGFIVSAAAAVAYAIDPASCRVMLLATRSTEPGQLSALSLIKAAADRCSLARLVLDMDLRIGEVTGALLAVPLLKGAAAVLADMATLKEVLAIELPPPVRDEEGEGGDLFGPSGRLQAV